jgi:hypoxia up-regulated 1
MRRHRFSPLSLLLGAIFLFATNVFAISAVLGVDLGTEYIKAALVKPGIPLEIVLTKDSRRKEISAVAFKPSQDGPKAGSFPERLYGSDAMAVAPRFPGDVYPNLKTLLGLPLDHSVVQEYAARHPALQLEENKVRGTAAFKSNSFVPEEEAWMVEELLAMELQSVRKNAEVTAGDGSAIRSIVVTVPPFYTIEEKRAVQLAADLAGLKVLSLISDGLAVGLNYATSRQFPNINEGAKPEHHLVFDMGAGSTKATVMKFQSRTVKDVGKYNKTVQEVQVLGSGWDRSLGGDALNALIVDDMIAQFVDSKGAKQASVAAESVKGHGRAIAKLMKEAERARQVLSANANTQANFEGLYDDVDFKYKLKRSDFEAMASNHAERVGTVINTALRMANLDVSDIDSVILHGGATRTPFVQAALEKVVGSPEKIRANVNSDEAALFGAGFRAADLSPSFRVKEIRIAECAAYSAGMKWTDPKEKPRHQRLWAPTSHLGAAPKEVTVPNHEDLSITFYQQVDSEEINTKVMMTKNLTASVGQLKEKYSCLDADIQFKVALKLAGENGEVTVAKATVECEAEEPEKEGIIDGVKNLFGFGNKKEQQPMGGEGSESSESEGASVEAASEASSSTTESVDTATTSSMASSDSAEASASSETPQPEKKEKKKILISIPVDYTLEDAGVPAFSKDETKKLKDRLKAFETSDRARVAREEANNQLEGYTYKIRDLLENDDFIKHSTDKERTTLQTKANDASEWQYGDGASASKDDIKKRYKELEALVVPTQKRMDEAAKRPGAVDDLKNALKQTTEFLVTIRKQITDYEDWQKSAAESSSTSADSQTTEPSKAESAGEFDGLEDDETTTATPEQAKEDLPMKDRGPVPPLYKIEDLDVVQKLYDEIAKWLDENVAKQDVLPATADPVMLVKDIVSRREKLDKAGMDLAMKGVKNFESKNKKKKGGDKTKKSSSSKTAGGARSQKTIDLGNDGESFLKFTSGEGGPTEEEIQEMLKKIKIETTDGKKKDKAKEHDEL